MALNHHLQELVDNEKIGFEDVFELYATLCIEHVREMTNDIIDDEGIEELTKSGMSLTTESLTEQAVEWAHDVVPEMLADIVEGPRKSGESWLQYIIRRKIEQRVEEVKAFKIKIV